MWGAYWTVVIVWGAFGLLPANLTRIDNSTVADCWKLAGLLLLAICIGRLVYRLFRRLVDFLADRKKLSEIKKLEDSNNIPPRN